MADIPTVVLSLASCLGMNGFLGWYFKERITMRLKWEHEKELEQFKSKLQVSAAERNVRLTHVFEKTAEALATTYSKLIEARNAATEFTKPDKTTEEDTLEELAFETCDQKLADFWGYYELNKIYFPKQTTARIELFHSTLKESIVAYFGDKTESTRDLSKQWEELLVDLLEALEDDFQRILGLMPEPIQLPEPAKKVLKPS